MKTFIIALFMLFAASSNAQITKVSLQASGLTCSMCSKAVKTALEAVSFVEKVQVNIKEQQYNLSFKEGARVDLDALNKAVKDAGFSVASMKATANISNVTLQKDEHLQLGGQNFHFLNAASQTLNGAVQFSVVDKDFVTAKEFKKYAAMTKMSCVQTGRMAKCCAADDVSAGTRIYHVII